MAQYKIIAVFCQHAKINGSRGVPLILNFDDFEDVAAQVKPDGTFVGPVPGIAFDS